MCGLAGVAATGGAALPGNTSQLLRQMGAALGHRGPDGERLFEEGPVGLAFRRLALVDPEGGDQPLYSDDGTVVLIANGEVYNHKELETSMPGVRMATRSDCEVLAHLYARDGLRFLDNVAGMFAIVLYDRRRNRLVLARDRFGIKPMYYARVPSGIVFGSEVKTLFRHPQCPRRLDWAGAIADQALHSAPHFSTAPVTSWFEGIESVPAGTIVSFDLATGAVDSHVYWRLPSFDGASDLSEQEFVTEYRRLLSAAVRDCATADAEVGVFLSGGVDSAAVAALTRGVGLPAHTFTVLNGSTLANGDARSAHEVAAYLGLPNHQLLVDARWFPDVVEYKRLLWMLETPQCGPEQFYKYELYRLAKQLRPELKGMLLGQASDEFNGGYSPVFSGDTEPMVGEDASRRHWAGFEAALAGLSRSTALLDDPRAASWFGHGGPPLLHIDAITGDRAGDPYDAFVRWKYRDLQQYNCWHEDRTAAGNGVEARVPFLDHRIVELMATVPATMRASLLWDKAILRTAVADLLPAHIAGRPKVGFYHGEFAHFTHRAFVRVLRQQDNALVEEALAAPGAAGVLHADGLRAMLAGLADNPAPAMVELLLRLVNLGLLDAMTHNLPPVALPQPAHLVGPRSPIRDWVADLPTVEAEIFGAAPPRLDDVFALHESVLVVHEPDRSDTLYVAIDGQFEYVVDSDAGAWALVLPRLDGKRPLGDVLTECGAGLDGVRDALVDAIGRGMLCRVSSHDRVSVT